MPGALDNSLVIEVEPGRFEDMVVAALDGLPEELGRLMRNVAVTVEHDPGPPGLLGLYQGVPLTSRTSQYAGVLPDRITIYRQAICATCRAVPRWLFSQRKCARRFTLRAMPRARSCAGSRSS